MQLYNKKIAKQILAFPYSLVDETLIVGPGNFPDLRTGIKGTFRLIDTRGPNKNPLASRPANTRADYLHKV